ncbi:hypothetical protein N9030_01475 [bacterium]|nr:hypothetical protein [bacterium]
MQPPETVEMQGKHSNLIRIFPGIYMDPEEFQSEKRPRQESNVPVSGRLLPSLRSLGVASGDNSGDGLAALVRVLELWPKLAGKHQDLIADTVEALANVSQPVRPSYES